LENTLIADKQGMVDNAAKHQSISRSQHDLLPNKLLEGNSCASCAHPKMGAGYALSCPRKSSGI
jgi:hypothetical protein